MTKIKVAICQHSLSADIDINMQQTISLMKKASQGGADIALMPECNLTGYAGIEFIEYKSKNNSKLNNALTGIKDYAIKLNLSIIAGGYWFDKNNVLPFNSMFVIGSRGNDICRYDKRMLTAGESGDDVNFFHPGSVPGMFMLNGVRCGLLICHEWRYPELYREYKKLGVQVIFQSWYDANVDTEEYQKQVRDHGSLIMGAVRSNAANNYLWICGSNASNRESSIGSFICRPDGKVLSSLPRNRSGILIKEIDLSQRFIDPSKHNRETIINK